MYQAIINEMPPHERYIEPFIGGGSILLHKKPARESLVADLDPAIAARWSTIAANGDYPDLTAVHGDARSIIAALREGSDRRTLIYCDPPYVRSARRSAKDIYTHEMTDDDHAALLKLLLIVRCNVMVSGYRSPLYDDLLRNWRRVDFKAMTRRGPAVESLWCNFETQARHDYTFLGGDFRERERIKRKKARWRAKLEKMPAQERAAILEVLTELSSRPATSGDAGHRRASSKAGGGNRCPTSTYSAMRDLASLNPASGSRDE